MTSVSNRLLERQSELTVLDDCFASAAVGEGRLVVISGEAGVGKTALARELSASHRGSAQVLWAQCDPLHTPRALGPVLDLAGAAGGDLANLADTDDRHRLFAEFIASWTNASSAVIAVIDDLQWADAATLDFVTFVGRRLDLTRCVLVVTHRDEIARDHPLRGVLGDLATAQALRRLRLAPLSEGAVAQLAAETHWDAGELHRLSAGVPFVVNELLTAEPGALTSVHDSVLARTGRLDAEAREVLDAASLLSDGAPVSVLRQALAGSERGIEACVEAGLLVHDGHTLSFRHELARQVVDTAITPTRRARVCTTRSSAGSSPREASTPRCAPTMPSSPVIRQPCWSTRLVPPGAQRCWAPIARRSPSTSGRCDSPEASHRRSGLCCSTSTRPSSSW